MFAVPGAWADLPFFTDSLPYIERRIGENGWLPGPTRVFAALEAAPPARVKVVILGQDPYPTPGHANGLAFSVNPGVAFPASLRNIFKEIESDLGLKRTSGDLSDWAAQGVLLFNTSLSVMPGSPASHSAIGWEPLARQVIAKAGENGPLAFILWGRHAQDVARGLVREEDFVLSGVHPSPLSAYRGFFGSRPFSQVNVWLERRGKTPIVWA